MPFLGWIGGGSCLEKLVKVCFESSGGERSRPRMSIVEERRFNKSREIPGISANLFTGSKKAVRVLRTSQRQQNSRMLGSASILAT